MITIPDKRIESDVHLAIRLKDGGVPIAWDSLEIEQICMYSVAQKAFAGQCSYAIDPSDNLILNVLYPASEQSYLGEHRIVARVKLHGVENTYDALAFAFKPYTDSEGSVDLGTVEVGIEVKEVDTTIMKEILTACQAATDKALQTDKGIANEEVKRAESERLRKEAEAARVTAENLRVEAETARAESERLRKEAETARVESEKLRKEAESARVTAEDLRVKAEAARVTAENLRVEAETARAESERLRKEAEAARVKAEKSRTEFEEARAKAETLRAAEEKKRADAEDLRVKAEAARVTAENLRVQAEAARVTAEKGREDTVANAIKALKEASEYFVGAEGQKVLCQAIAQLMGDTDALKSQISEGGIFHAESIDCDSLPTVAATPFFIKGAGAPAAAPKVPFSEYWDSESNKFYKAKGKLTNSVSDWVALN